MKKLKLILQIFVMVVTSVSFADGESESSEPIINLRGSDFFNSGSSATQEYNGINLNFGRNSSTLGGSSNNSSYDIFMNRDLSNLGIGEESTTLLPRFGNLFGDTSRNGTYQTYNFTTNDCQPSFDFTNISSVPFELSPPEVNAINLRELDLSAITSNEPQIGNFTFEGVGCYPSRGQVSGFDNARLCSDDCKEYRNRPMFSLQRLLTTDIDISPIDYSDLLIQNIEDAIGCCEGGICSASEQVVQCNQLLDTFVSGDVPEGLGDVSRVATIVGVRENVPGAIPEQASPFFCNNCLSINRTEMQFSQRNLIEEATPNILRSNFRNFFRNGRATNNYAYGSSERFINILNDLSEEDRREVLGEDFEHYSNEGAAGVIQKYTCDNFDNQLIEALQADPESCGEDAANETMQKIRAFLAEYDPNIANLDNIDIDAIINPLTNIGTDESIASAVGENSDLRSTDGQGGLFGTVESHFNQFMNNHRDRVMAEVCNLHNTDPTQARLNYSSLIFNDVFNSEDSHEDRHGDMRMSMRDSLIRTYSDQGLSSESEISSAYIHQFVSYQIPDWLTGGTAPMLIPVFQNYESVCNQLQESSSFSLESAVGLSSSAANNRRDAQTILNGLRNLHNQSCGSKQVELNKKLICGQAEMADIDGHPALIEFIVDDRNGRDSIPSRLAIAQIICDSPPLPTDPPPSGGANTQNSNSSNGNGGGVSSAPNPFQRNRMQRGSASTRIDATNQRESIFTGARSDILGAESKKSTVGTSAANFNGGLTSNSSKGESELSAMSALDNIRQFGSTSNFSSNASIFNNRRLSSAAISAALESDTELASEVQNKTQELQSLLDNTPGSVGESAADRMQDFLAGNTDTALVPSLVDDARAQELQAEINDLRAQLAESARVSDRARPTDERLEEALSEIERLRGTVANLQTTQRGILSGSSLGSETASAVSGSPVELGSVRGGQFASLNSEAGRSPSSVSSSNAIPTNIASLIQNQSGNVGFALEGEQLVIRSGGSIYPAELDNIVVNNGVVQGIVYRGNEISFDALSPESRQAIQRFVEASTPGLIEEKIEEIQASVADIPVEVIQTDTDGAEYLQLLEEMRLAASPASN